MQDIFFKNNKINGIRAADEKHPKTGVYLSNEEYEDLLLRIKDAESRVKSTKNEYLKQSEDLKNEVQKKEIELKNQIEDLTLQRDDLTKLNKNLIRICKERSCAERGLRPKKQHSGYVMRSLQQKYYDKAHKHLAWQALIQTPYLTDFTPKEVTKMIEIDHKVEELIGSESIIEQMLKANYVCGYWELICLFERRIK